MEVSPWWVFGLLVIILLFCDQLLDGAQKLVGDERSAMYEVKFALAMYSGFSVASGTYFYIRLHVLVSGT
eukprot:scaffold130935_cov63-Attheya_sp.AAC.1